MNGSALVVAALAMFAALLAVAWQAATVAQEVGRLNDKMDAFTDGAVGRALERVF